MDEGDNTVLSKKRKAGVAEDDYFNDFSAAKKGEKHCQEFVPHCFLQCHDSSNDATDFSQQVWCCKFQPNSNDIVATCGSESVCVIDANSAKVKAKFTKAGEEFYTVDWTTMNTGTFASHVLACGGTLGFVYLIHVEQFCVYGFFKAHSKPVQTMAFVPGQHTLLLTAGNEKKIYLWDIGALSLPDYHFSQKKLAVFENLEFSPLKMITLHNEYLFCASEGGLFCWHTGTILKNNPEPQKCAKFPDICEIQFLFVDGEPVVDGLALVEDNLLATKCAQVGVIFLWKPSSVLSKIKAGNSTVTAPITRELKWSNTQQFYINITACKNFKTLFAGDEKGSIWVYDCGSKPGKSTFSPKKVSFLSGKPQSASQIVQWPFCKRENSEQILNLDGTVLNDICCSDDMRYVVVAADDNLVCIYKLVS